MGYWTTELVRLNKGRLVESTIPAEMDGDVMDELTNRLASLVPPNWEGANSWQDAVFLPAACGPKLFFRLAHDPIKKQDEPISEVEAMAISCLRSFHSAVGLRISSSASADIHKVASCFETNDYRTKVVALRKDLVYVDRVNGVTSYVPPPAEHVSNLIKDLYGMIARKVSGCTAALALAFYGMCHFIAIHPLDDGNGRLARALFIRLCTRGGISVWMSGAIIALLHVKHATLFYPALMKYCLSGDMSMLADLLALSIGEIGNLSEVSRSSPGMDDRCWSAADFSDPARIACLRRDLNSLIKWAM